MILWLNALWLMLSDMTTVIFILLVIVLCAVGVHINWIIKINRLDIKKQIIAHCKDCPLNRRRKNYV